ncbi:MAG: class I SAM-dependent methyltransferase [Prevotella sp.]|nr:class I SAM-dependent methyltransferase [Staphylococcus sp.]MCM1349702.1 class I SAM-dependent methyltransferase [Prevotella sp.]
MLSKRLMAVLDYIGPNEKIVDVGCDHGYLAKAAIAKGVQYVQLVDNKKMPLARAKANLSTVEKDAHIIYTLASGLTLIDHEITVACICGMGGDLIASILDESIAQAQKMHYLLLQPNTKVDHLRAYLSKHAFVILDEQWIVEKEKYYPILKVKYAADASPLSPLEIAYGPCLLRHPNDTFIAYLNRRIAELSVIIQAIDSSGQDYKKLCLQVKEIEEVLNGIKENH